MRARPLTVPARDLWLLADAAAQADLPCQAREWADQAWARSGPTRYREVAGWLGYRFLECPPMPRGYVYYASTGPHDHHVLVHPDATSFVRNVVGMRVFIETMRATGLGLQPMEPLLAAMLRFEPPDNAEEL